MLIHESKESLARYRKALRKLELAIGSFEDEARGLGCDGSLAALNSLLCEFQGLDPDDPQQELVTEEPAPRPVPRPTTPTYEPPAQLSSAEYLDRARRICAGETVD